MDLHNSIRTNMKNRENMANSCWLSLHMGLRNEKKNMAQSSSLHRTHRTNSWQGKNTRSCSKVIYKSNGIDSKLHWYNFPSADIQWDFTSHSAISFTCDRRKISGCWWVRFVLLVELGHHLDISGVVGQDSLVFFLDAHVRQVQWLELTQKPQSPLGGYNALKSLVHERANSGLKE